MKKTVLVLDCGATNVRTIAVDETGELVASASKPNNTKPDPFHKNGLIWDIEEIWGKFKETTRQVIANIDPVNISGVTVTTFGVDCAPVDKNGKILYPVISWACQRTASIMENIDKYIPLNKLYQLNGVNKFSFNSINKLIWFKEQKKDILEKTHQFVFISALLLQKLSGELISERTMAGTSMLTDIKSQDFSEEILKAIGYNKGIFPPIAEAGQIIGKTTEKVQKETSIPTGIPVMASGHDTQFAIFGAGGNKNQPVLSSGTWEILMVRTPNINPDKTMFKAGVTTELDPIKGLYTPGIQWLGSGILEWVKKMFYAAEVARLKPDDVYEKMIADAEILTSSNIKVNQDFLNNKGGVTGLGLDTKREEIYLAAIQSLAIKTKLSLNLLEKNCGFETKAIICVGGGSKNRLWNKERMKALGVPLLLTQKKETTVLGAALFALAGAGLYKDAEEARKVVDYSYEEIS